MNKQGVTRAYIGLGGNLDNPSARIQRAFIAFNTMPKTTLILKSSLYRTAPVGYLDQPDFINAVAAIDTSLEPIALLDALLHLELDEGRSRSFKNAPRTLDLDILMYGDQQISLDHLIVPHPRMGSRAFVLFPLQEIAPDLVIPEMGSVKQLAAQCEDQVIERLEASSP